MAPRHAPHPAGLPGHGRAPRAAGRSAGAGAFAAFDELYVQPGGSSPLAEVVERLGAAAPSDAAAVDLGTYKGLVAPWNDWGHVRARGRHWASVLARGQLAGGVP